MRTTDMQLNTAMQAVDAFLEIDGRTVRVIVPREVLERRMHTEHSPDAWLKSCEKHVTEISAVARRRLAARRQDFVVVRCSDFGLLDSE